MVNKDYRTPYVERWCIGEGIILIRASLISFISCAAPGDVALLPVAISGVHAVMRSGSWHMLVHRRAVELSRHV